MAEFIVCFGSDDEKNGENESKKTKTFYLIKIVNHLIKVKIKDFLVKIQNRRKKKMIKIN